MAARSYSNRIAIRLIMIQVTNRTQTIRENTTLTPEGYGGWMAMNIGTGNVEVDGFVIKPGEKLDFSHLDPCVVWNSAIPIVCSAGGVLRITRLIYNKKA